MFYLVACYSMLFYLIPILFTLYSILPYSVLLCSILLYPILFYSTLFSPLSSTLPFSALLPSSLLHLYFWITSTLPCSALFSPCLLCSIVLLCCEHLNWQGMMKLWAHMLLHTKHFPGQCMMQMLGQLQLMQRCSTTLRRILLWVFLGSQSTPSLQHGQWHLHTTGPRMCIWLGWCGNLHWQLLVMFCSTSRPLLHYVAAYRAASDSNLCLCSSL